MTNLSKFPESMSADSCTLYLDEAGDCMLFASGGRALVGAAGCSRFFILGKLEVMNAAALAADLAKLRLTILADPYFQGVPSLDPARKKTAIMFHARDDLAEVRHQVFTVLRQHALRFYAVVRDKERLLDYATQRRRIEPNYRYDPTGNELYDELTRELFGRVHRVGQSADVIFAKRGNKPRVQAFREAVEDAERAFINDPDLNRGKVTSITAAQPKDHAGLQAVDYFLWALQRFYERGEDRYVRLIWPQTVMVADLDAEAAEKPNRGEAKLGMTFNEQCPLSLATRAGIGNKGAADIG
jgi:hypothetical protein